MKQLFRTKLFCGLLSTLLLVPQLVTAKEPLKVLTSIKPIQLISQAITEGVTTTDVLLPPGASPHSHSLKPSDARKLYDADVMFWIGPDMEVFLEKMLAGAPKTLSVPLMEQSRLSLRKNDEEGEVHEHEEGHHHHHGEYDAHIWLSPDNALAMAKTMSEKLISVDPEHKKQYQENFKKFATNLQQADKNNIARLENYHDQPMFVFHDAYGYLKAHYKLNIVDHFTINPERQPGAKHLAKLRDKLIKAGNSCVFREPQFQPAYIDKIINGTNTNVAVLDPLATEIRVDSTGYINFLNRMVSNIITCLK
ncbi:zinc ABC transporter substrate-binding protein [Endozoicomonas sp. OPT23]|uniref:zinc ABC transporter substrate-binding protein ZnuA n=1 Tax=Endozoicomonas sp. OPT23 TaxID=2072845 RepID=UPI00129B4C52|nr:zinc ABC transporter substrate-binding protein ZnuA [Endozoicomonas sp. OPT23]MRI33290.1 zinc ABC transporter substrate-binding protein [Endozoicomonas sp. OPT23]